MNLKIIPSVFVLVTVLLLAQTVSVVDAHHKTDNGEARKAAETKSKDFDKKTTTKSATGDQKRKAFSDYKIAFSAWKSAKELWKAAKSSGISSDISGNKTLLDAAKITKDEAWKTYQEVKKKKLR